MKEKVLVVSSIEKDTERLARLFRSFNIETLTVAYASKARRALLENEFSMIVVNTPLSDEFGTDFAVNAAEKTFAGVLLFVKADLFVATLEKAESRGVFVLEKPLSIPMNEAVRITRAISFRLNTVRAETEKLQKKISETRAVERAKTALIQYENMSEDEAHKYIERRAMDRRIGKGELAAEILRRYGD
ncbi:MAG: ANTAR domain-containing protein [Clostridiales bacterium]|nr:ANTAR domain-containing protein [Clostridiales bacterium]